MAWYNKYRPNSFDDVLGQELVKSVLTNSLTKNKIKHAYLLSGPKGVGKTTLARIFAKELNQINTNSEASIDIIEMDAASNTGIDDIRQLINSAKTPPISGQYKIYIIDEVHMLSKQAMNALLKILEEPPSYIVFLLATTNPEKIIPTVISRLTKLNLSGHNINHIIEKLRSIASLENINIDSESLNLIAKRAGGSQRDAINLLETISTYELDKYDISKTSELLGTLPLDLLDKLIAEISNSSITSETITKVEASGIDPDSLLAQLLDHLLDLSFINSSTNSTLINNIAQVISYQLPISSTTSAIALIVSNYQANIIDPKTNPNLNNQKIVPTLPKKPIVTTEPKSDLYQEIPLTHKNLENFLEELKKDSPPMIKMILTDLFIGSVETNSICLCVTNGIIESQIKSDKNFQWLKQKLNDNFDNEVNIEIQVQKPTSSPNHTQNTVDEEDFILESGKTHEIEIDNQSIDSQVKKIDNSKIFYKIYKQLPKEIADSSIPVYTEQIPNPNTIEESITDIFELE
ncbi:MAG: DNA polymerase III subunit gamma/tau [Thermales bacterium]|nr:DNA polymerase III subunit gamma/tau [Thermales bacterium]